MANRLISLNLLFLLLLLIPTANSMRGNQTKTDAQTSNGVKQEKKEKSVKQHESNTLKKTEDDPLGKEITQEELAAVDGNISAVYIIRVIQIRAEALKKLKTDAMAKIPDGTAINEELNRVNKLEDKTEDHQTLSKQKKGKKNKEEAMHDFSVELWKESNLSDAEMGNLTSGLAGALKEVADLDYILVGPLKERMKKVKYLTAVYGYIERFETKKKESDTSQHLFGKFGKMAKSLFGQYPPADQVEMCNQLRDKHLDFLNQIRLELELHYTFIYVDKEKFETMATHLKNKYKPLYDLNSAAESVYMNIASVLRWPLKDTNEQNFVTSLSEVAQKAKAQEPIHINELHRKVRGKFYLQSIFNIAEAVDPTFHDITPESLWRKYLHKEIGDELAMPQGWFERTQAKAHQKPINEIVKEEMMNAEVDILLAKTLLVYERLNKFYKIAVTYINWKNKELKDRLLKYYFKKFDEEKMKKQKEVADSPAQANDTQNA